MTCDVCQPSSFVLFAALVCAIRRTRLRNAQDAEHERRTAALRAEFHQEVTTREELARREVYVIAVYVHAAAEGHATAAGQCSRTNISLTYHLEHFLYINVALPLLLFFIPKNRKVSGWFKKGLERTGPGGSFEQNRY